MKTSNRNLIIALPVIIFISLIQISSSVRSLSDFNGGIFNINGLSSGIYQVNITPDLNQNGQDDMLMAYGDFNGDKAVDFVTATSSNSNSKVIKIYLFDKSADDFLVMYPCNPIHCYGSDTTIVNIIPVDINYDGMQDIIYITYESTTNTYTVNTLIQTQSQTSALSFSVLASNFVFTSLQGQPFATQLQNNNGNHLTSLIYYNGGQRMFATLNIANNPPVWNQSSFGQLIDPECPNLALSNSFISIPFSNPHYNSAIDLNGDCRSDLYFTSVYQGVFTHEVWIKQSDSDFYCLAYQLPGTNSVYGITFQDINLDGAPDLVGAISGQTTDSIFVFFNQNSVDSSDLCSRTSKPAFTNLNNFGQGASYMFSLDTGYKLYANSTIFRSPVIRFADLYFSGYPSFGITVYDTTNLTNVISLVYDSTSCPTPIDTQIKNCYYYEKSKSFDLLLQQSSYSISFMDLLENGHIDIMLMTWNPAISGYTLTSYYNYLSSENFFLKAFGLNGYESSDFNENDNAISGNYYGATIMCKITSVSSDMLPGVGNQLFQSAFAALQLPYSIIGLSRTNNYVENFAMGLPLQSGTVKVWTPIIPNSQLIVYPISNSASKWQIGIYIQPTTAVIVVIVVTSIILIILACIILYYHKKEKDEDKSARVEFIHLWI